MPHRESNIPESIFYSALAGEFLRMSRYSMLQDDLISSSRDLISRMKRQGGKVNRINRVLRKVTTKHPGSSVLFCTPGTMPDFYYGIVLDPTFF